MVNPLFQIEIPRRNQLCCKGGEKLEPGMDYYSLLSKDDEQKMVRQDFCLNCWQQVKQEQSLHGHSYWRSRIELKKDLKAQESGRLARALSLLKTMLTDPNSQEAEIFVLAVFLAYQKRLVARQEIEKEGKAYTLYEIAYEDQFLTIPKLNVASLDPMLIQQSLAKQLHI